jgi:hypothetical protein
MPQNSSVYCDFDIHNLWTKCFPQNKFMLCAPYTCPKEGGRPREEKRVKSLVEKLMEEKKKS